MRQLALLRLVHRSGKHDGAARAGRSDGPRALSRTGAGAGPPIAASSITAPPPTPKGSRGMPTRAPAAVERPLDAAMCPTTRRTPHPRLSARSSCCPKASRSSSPPDFVEGPFPEHYEPVESPVENALHPKVGSNPAGEDLPERSRQARDSRGAFPYVGTHLSPDRTLPLLDQAHRNELRELQPHFFVEVPGGARSREGHPRAATWCACPRRAASVEGRAMVTKRMTGSEGRGQDRLPGRAFRSTGDFIGRVTGPLINNLTPSRARPQLRNAGVQGVPGESGEDMISQPQSDCDARQGSGTARSRSPS